MEKTFLSLDWVFSRRMKQAENGPRRSAAQVSKTPSCLNMQWILLSEFCQIYSAQKYPKGYASHSKTTFHHLETTKNRTMLLTSPKKLQRNMKKGSKAIMSTSFELVFGFNKIDVTSGSRCYKISMKNSKCAISNKHIQDDRPGRYENRRRTKKTYKQNTL